LHEQARLTLGWRLNPGWRWLVVSHGAVRKEYVLVPAGLLENTAELQPYFAESLAYVGSLKPKPATK
jgi:hypothetical protein